MKNLTLSIALLLASLCSSMNAQYVTIPDTNFAIYLQSIYPQCMVGYQLDTTCNAVVTEQGLSCSSKNISDITGVEYFDNLRYFSCNNNTIDSINALPPNLVSLLSYGNGLTYIAYLPDNIATLSLYTNNLTTLPTLPSALIELNVKNNNLTTLTALPPNIVTLYAENNQIDTIPYLPSKIKTLTIQNNRLSSLPTLPDSLNLLYCSHNPISSFPALPNGLEILHAGYSILLSSLPQLPDSLKRLNIAGTSITSVPNLPYGLEKLDLPSNQINSLPAFPNTLTKINIINNNISFLPELPDSLSSLSISNNPISCLPELKKIVDLNIGGTNITCLPNYGQVTYSYPALSSLPLCDMYNNNGCDYYYNITGRAYLDTDSNCVKDLQDTTLASLKVQLWRNGQLIQQMFTGREGFYSFDVQNSPGSYVTTIDDALLPFQVSCPDTGYYTSVVTATDTIFLNNDFGLNCNGMSDLSVFNMGRSYGWFRPASTHQLRFVVGDISQLYGSGCNDIAGQVMAIMDGPASFASFNGLAPTYTNGDSVIWDVADFSMINIRNSFQFHIDIDSFAQPQSQICFEVFVSSTTGDTDTSNNYGSICFEVANSYDPNNKEVYPLSYIDTTQEWLYYTINFQNTGTAPALHVRIEDTLSSYLDLSSIQLLSYSHDNYTQISQDGVINFNFPNINLPDSTNDEPGSHGFIKYKVKLNEGLPVGTTIENTAYIYFDLNSAIVTNTTENTIIVPVAKPTVSANSFNGCEGDTIELETVYYPSYTYTWYKNDTAIINSNSITLQAYLSGTYKVGVTDGITNETSDEQIVTINPLPVATLTATSNTVCEDAPAVMLTPSPTGGSYTGATVTGNEFDPAANNIGVNTIEYYYTDVNGCSDSATLDIMVNEKPTVTFTLPTATYCEGGDAVDLSGFGDPAGGTFSGSSVSNGMLDVSAVGTLTVEYTYTDNNGCTNSKQVNAIVEVCDGIEELEALGINIFPNPASNTIWIEFTDNTTIQQVKLIDLNGKVVATATTTYNGFNIDVSELPSQTYLLIMANEEGKVVNSSTIQIAQ